jgi:tetratricopeptide (TPR) repeat protein
MKTTFSTMPKRLVLALALCLAGATTTQLAFAAAEEPRPSAPTIDERTGRVLTQAFEQLTAEDFAGATATLQGLNMARLSPYERSRVEQIYFSIAVQSEDFASARQHAQAAIDSGGLNENEVSQFRYQLAQIYMQEENWAAGARALEEWLSTAANPTPAAYYLLAIAYYQQEQINQALVPAQKALDLAGDAPQESWLQLVMALYLQQENYDAALPVVQRALTLFPGRKNYWTQLSSIYATKEDYANALVVLELANHAGLLTEAAELRRLADMYMVREMPYRAATLLQKLIDDKVLEGDLRNYEALSNALVASREYEKALPVLDRAGQLSDDGDLFVRAGEVNMQLENWQAAAEAFGKGLNKGGLRDTATPQMMTGIAYYNLGNYDEAERWFNRSSSANATKSTSTAYLQLIDNKRQQQQN